ncbi:hypothetical protein COP2_014516 [Malus domestica]
MIHPASAGGHKIKSRIYPSVLVSAILERKGTSGTLFLLLSGGSLEFSISLKNFVDLLTQELKLWKIRNKLIWLCWRLKKIASQYQKEADKCSSGMETCEEAREKGREENIVVGASYLFHVWVAQRPPGYAFVDFDDSRDADDAIRELDVTDNYKQENITTFPLKSLYCLIIRTISFYSSSQNKVADPQAIKIKVFQQENYLSN